MCFWWWDHKWAKWEILDEGQIITTTVLFQEKPLGVITGRWIRQKRVCEQCQKLQLRTEATRI